MADTRGLKVNKDIYDFETIIYGLYDSLPAKHKHTLSELMLKSVLEMRHYSNLACHYHKEARKRKAELFSLRQASLSITNSRSSPRLMSIESVMPPSHLILCRPLLLLPPIPPSIRVFSNESTLCMRWPK